ncbi:peptidylprolyl isomerase [Actinokineospora sp. UTMC 2448]|uniref:peptidylprolyl isomerase n=1 Tax=Actinokineospora sp. UTMC 2448 TaxID=2268449 RepID=UPI002868D669|nr:peptidylprolyl isomerase [Actinokineospora sp. UTMC 2448]
MRVRFVMAVALLACAAGCDASTPDSAAASAATTATTTTVATTSASCDYRPTPEDPPADGRDVGLPSGVAAPDVVILLTNHGEITMAMSRATPCTTASISHLATSGFYTGSPCHRMTKAETLSVLQCGDPTGTGSGGPGYTLPDENPTDLKPASTAGYVTYPRGTVAMANTGEPHSGGSQFFLVYADSTLPPTYAVFATLDEASLAVLDKIAEGGVAGGGRDGAPAVAVTIEKALAA